MTALGSEADLTGSWTNARFCLESGLNLAAPLRPISERSRLAQHPGLTRGDADMIRIRIEVCTSQVCNFAPYGSLLPANSQTKLCEDIFKSEGPTPSCLNCYGRKRRISDRRRAVARRWFTIRERGALSFSGDRQRTMRQPLTIHGNGTARTGRNTPTLGRHRGRCTRWLTIVAVAGSFSLVALPTIISPALTTRGNGMAKRGLRWPIPGRHDVQRQRWPLTASEGEPCCSEDTTARSASVTPG